MAMAVAGCLVVSFVMLALGSRRDCELDRLPQPDIDPVPASVPGQSTSPPKHQQVAPAASPNQSTSTPAKLALIFVGGIGCDRVKVGAALENTMDAQMNPRLLRFYEQKVPYSISALCDPSADSKMSAISTYLVNCSNGIAPSKQAPFVAVVLRAVERALEGGDVVALVGRSYGGAIVSVVVHDLIKRGVDVTRLFAQTINPMYISTAIRVPTDKLSHVVTVGDICTRCHPDVLKMSRGLLANVDRKSKPPQWIYKKRAEEQQKKEDEAYLAEAKKRDKRVEYLIKKIEWTSAMFQSPDELDTSKTLSNIFWTFPPSPEKVPEAEFLDKLAKVQSRPFLGSLEMDIHEISEIASESVMRFMASTAKKAIEMGLLTPETPSTP